MWDSNRPPVGSNARFQAASGLLKKPYSSFDVLLRSTNYSPYTEGR